MWRIALIAILVSAWQAGADFPETDNPDLAALKAQIEAGEAAAAIPVLKVALGAAPTDSDILTMLGYAHRKAGDFDPARRYYDRALTLNPRNVDALEYLGEMELELGNPVAARGLLFRLVAVCPGCEQRGELEEAFRARGLDPSGEGYE